MLFETSAWGRSQITESQNSWGWQGPLECIWSNPFLKQGQQEQVVQDHIQMAFDDLHNLSGQCSVTHTVNKCFPILRQKLVFQLVFTTSSLGTGHHRALLVFFAPSLWVYTLIRSTWDSFFSSGQESFKMALYTSNSCTKNILKIILLGTEDQNYKNHYRGSSAGTTIF